MIICFVPSLCFTKEDHWCFTTSFFYLLCPCKQLLDFLDLTAHCKHDTYRLVFTLITMTSKFEFPLKQ